MYEDILDQFLSSKQAIAKKILDASPKKTKQSSTDIDETPTASNTKLPFEVSKVLKRVEEYRVLRAKKSKKTKQDGGAQL